MQKLGEIIDSVRDGGRPDYEDLRYAICAMSALMTFDRLALSTLATAEMEGKKPILSDSAVFQHEENFSRVKRALIQNPKEYVGWNNDPENQDFLARRAKSIRLVKALIK
jgi:hypothetical protein